MALVTDSGGVYVVGLCGALSAHQPSMRHDCRAAERPDGPVPALLSQSAIL